MGPIHSRHKHGSSGGSGISATEYQNAMMQTALQTATPAQNAVLSQINQLLLLHHHHRHHHTKLYAGFKNLYIKSIVQYQAHTRGNNGYNYFQSNLNNYANIIPQSLITNAANSLAR